MPDLPPHVTTYKDRHGKTRYRFRRNGFPPRSIPGDPSQERFWQAYREAAAGKARDRPGRNRFQPRTLAAAWAQVRASIEWKQLKPISQAQQTNAAERFLSMPIAAGASMTFGQMPFAGIRRNDVKRILARFQRPHAAEAVLRLLRKLCLVALDLEWIETDPTYRVKFRPRLIGHRAWTDAELQAFEARWPLGSLQRLAYALALYTGQRRGDLAAMPWTAYDGQGLAIVQEKTGAPLWIPVHPELKAILDATERRGETIIAGKRGGRFTRESLGNLMALAIDAAGLPPECRLHGLRKSAGRCLAEAGATTRMIMAILGHKTLKEAENYTRDVEQRKMAAAGIEQWSRPRLLLAKK